MLLLNNKPCSQPCQGKGKAQIPCIGIIAGPGSSGSSQDCSVRQWCRIIGNAYNPLTSYTKHLRCYRGCRLRRCTGSIRGIGIIRIVRSIRGCGRSSGRRRGCGIRCACRRRLRSSTGSRFPQSWSVTAESSLPALWTIKLHSEAVSGDAIICSNSFHHYPNPQAFFDSVKRCLRPGGRLVLRDVTSDNKLLLWFMDKIELPLANLCGHGDVTIATREVVTDCCKKAGLKVEKLEIRKGMRMHCVVSK